MKSAGKKGLVLFLCLSLLFPLMGCQGQEKTYSSESKGFGGAVKVTGTFKGDELTNIQIDAPDETPGVGGKAAEVLEVAILNAKSAEVDGVAGATYTSTAVLKAAKEVFAQAKGSSDEKVAVKMKPGTYTGTAKGYAGEIIATVKVSEDKIEEIKLEKKINKDHIITEDSPMFFLQTVAVNDLDQIFFDVAKLLPNRIIAAQSLSIDGITGATASSNGAILAIKNAITEAGQDPEGFDREVAKSTKKETYNCDVVVVGGGTSGTTAAAQATELGSKVVLVEKSARLGGTGGLSAGPMGINSTAQVAQGYGVDEKFKQDYYNHYEELMNWSIKGSLFSQIIDNSGETIDWLVGKGFELVPDTSFFAVAHGGAQLINAFAKMPYMGLETRGYFENMVKDVDTILTETTATELIKDKNGKITGIKAVKYDGTEITVNANAVIMATGGFAGNEEMQQEKLGAVYSVLGLKQNDGSGLTMMLKAGANEYNASTICTHAIGVPAEVTGFNGFDRAIPYSLITTSALLQVNDQGERFMNEEVQDFDMTRGSVTHSKQGSYYYALLSQEQVDDIAKKGTSSVGQNYEPMAFSFQYNTIGKDVPMSNIQAVLDQAITQELAYKGSLEEIASKIGADPAILKNNVSTYDAMCAAENDTLFGKKVSKLNTLGAGPYYAVKGTTVAYCTNGGVEVDTNCQVLDTKGKLIDGLYAVGVESQGNIMDGVSYTNVSGINLSWGFNSGRIAAKNAVEAISEK
ncbi:MAG: FAD-dependent oxidoreductase [Eubacteriaceae bacterium]|nr:FAD-dependent oxidoreductase [Eubacteriaceae bacterium]